ncbi:MAG: adenosylcobinamide-GDP ribazoletransferase [Pseudomonadota bacterium]
MQARRETGLRRQIALYFSAQQFLTRLPVPAWIGHEDDRLARAAPFFPVVGVLIGAIAGMIWLIAGALMPAPLAAGLALGAMILVTGALHEDGLADCCDGLGGGTTRARALEIMRDSRIGVFAAAGLIITIGLRWTSLGTMAPADGFACLLIAAVAGRAAITLMLAAGRYARDEGAARGVAGGVTAREAGIACLIAALTGLLAGAPGLLAVLLTLLASRLWLAYLTHRIGGYTGDGLGAAEQIGQVVVLLTLASVP